MGVRPAQPLELFGGHCHGLLHEDVDAPLQAFACDARLEEEERCDNGEVRFLAVQKAPVIVIEGNERRLQLIDEELLRVLVR